MIVVTGAYGFIGSCLIGFLNNQGITDIIAVDDFAKTEKEPNLVGKNIAQRIERDLFVDWLGHHAGLVSFVFHIGARTDTTEFDYAIHEKLNVQYSKDVFTLCQQYAIPIAYASSAATYGNGEWGYDDSDPSVSFQLQPLNPYGVSKNEFDKWVVSSQGVSSQLGSGQLVSSQLGSGQLVNPKLTTDNSFTDNFYSTDNSSSDNSFKMATLTADHLQFQTRELTKKVSVGWVRLYADRATGEKRQSLTERGDYLGFP